MAIPGRCELIDEEQAFGVIIDHARTPEALSRLLDCVKELGPRRIVTVVGCCGEKERGKRPMMTKIAAEKSDVVMLTSDNPASEDPLDILDDMLSGVGWTMEEYLKYGANDYYPPYQMVTDSSYMILEELQCELLLQWASKAMLLLSLEKGMILMSWKVIRRSSLMTGKSAAKHCNTLINCIDLE